MMSTPTKVLLTILWLLSIPTLFLVVVWLAQAGAILAVVVLMCVGFGCIVDAPGWIWKDR